MADTKEIIDRLKRLSEDRENYTRQLLDRDDTQEIDDEWINRRLQDIEHEAFRLIDEL